MNRIEVCRYSCLCPFTIAVGLSELILVAHHVSPIPYGIGFLWRETVIAVRNADITVNIDIRIPSCAVLVEMQIVSTAPGGGTQGTCHPGIITILAMSGHIADIHFQKPVVSDRKLCVSGHGCIGEIQALVNAFLDTHVVEFVYGKEPGSDHKIFEVQLDFLNAFLQQVL